MLIKIKSGPIILGAPPPTICGNGLRKNVEKDILLAGNEYCISLRGIFGGVPADTTP